MRRSTTTLVGAGPGTAASRYAEHEELATLIRCIRRPVMPELWETEDSKNMSYWQLSHSEGFRRNEEVAHGPRGRGPRKPRSSKKKNKTNKKSSNSFFDGTKYYRCGNNNHRAENCRSKDTECRACHKKGHLEKVCQTTSASEKKECYRISSNVSRKTVNNTTTRRPDVGPLLVEEDIEGAVANMGLDSGCGVSVMPHSRSIRLRPLVKQHAADVTLRQNVPSEWTAECQRAVEEIKRKLTSSVVLMQFDAKLPIVLATDASPLGISAILSHRMPDQRERETGRFLFESPHTN